MPTRFPRSNRYFRLIKIWVFIECLDLETIKDCPICRDDYEVGQKLMSLPCHHAFHPDCVKTWLLTSGTCPVWFAPFPSSNQFSLAKLPFAPPPSRFSLVPQPGDPAEDPVSPLAGLSNAPQSPSTARIPEMEGSRLPGSFPFPPGRGRSAGEGSEPEDLPMEDLD